MPKKNKRRSSASLSLAKARECKRQKRNCREAFQSLLEMRRASLKRWKLGKMLTFGMLLLLFLQMLNLQLMDGLTRYQAAERIGTISNVNSRRLRAKYDHFFRTGTILVWYVDFLKNIGFTFEVESKKRKTVKVKRIEDVMQSDVRAVHDFIGKRNQKRGSTVSKSY